MLKPQSSDGDIYESDPFIRYLPEIQRAIACVSRRRRLSREEAEDFTGLVALRLLEDDRAILRKYKGRSKLFTFLLVVVDRILLDDRVARWGKWRASAAARRLGPVAIALEQLMSRDSLSFDQACEALRINRGLSPSLPELRAMFERLPTHATRRFVGMDAAADKTCDAPPTDLRLLRPHALRTLHALRRALGLLTADERELIQLRFTKRRTVADIARLRGVAPKGLHAVYYRLLRRLRDELTKQGIAHAEVMTWLGDLDDVLGSS